MTYGTHKNLPRYRIYLPFFYWQYLVLFTMIPRNSMLKMLNWPFLGEPFSTIHLHCVGENLPQNVFRMSPPFPPQTKSFLLNFPEFPPQSVSFSLCFDMYFSFMYTKYGVHSTRIFVNCTCFR